MKNKIFNIVKENNEKISNLQHAIIDYKYKINKIQKDSKALKETFKDNNSKLSEIQKLIIDELSNQYKELKNKYEEMSKEEIMPTDIKEQEAMISELHNLLKNIKENSQDDEIIDEPMYYCENCNTEYATDVVICSECSGNVVLKGMSQKNNFGNVDFEDIEPAELPKAEQVDGIDDTADTEKTINEASELVNDISKDENILNEDSLDNIDSLDNLDKVIEDVDIDDSDISKYVEQIDELKDIDDTDSSDIVKDSDNNIELLNKEIYEDANQTSDFDDMLENIEEEPVVEEESIIEEEPIVEEESKIEEEPSSAVSDIIEDDSEETIKNTIDSIEDEEIEELENLDFSDSIDNDFEIDEKSATNQLNINWNDSQTEFNEDDIKMAARQAKESEDNELFPQAIEEYNKLLNMLVDTKYSVLKSKIQKKVKELEAKL